MQLHKNRHIKRGGVAGTRGRAPGAGWVFRLPLPPARLPLRADMKKAARRRLRERV